MTRNPPRDYTGGNVPYSPAQSQPYDGSGGEQGLILGRGQLIQAGQTSVIMCSHCYTSRIITIYWDIISVQALSYITNKALIIRYHSFRSFITSFEERNGGIGYYSLTSCSLYRVIIVLNFLMWLIYCWFLCVSLLGQATSSLCQVRITTLIMSNKGNNK